MKSRVTIKDIAAEAGVSIGTVHTALSDKKGVSDETRERIKELAKEMHYKPNTTASLLKRKELQIGICLPSTDGDGSYYPPQLWNGYRAYKEKIRDYNVSFREFSYSNNDGPGDVGLRQKLDRKALKQVLDKGELNGIVINGNGCPFTGEELREYVEKGLVLVLLDTDIPDSGRLTCVMADHHCIGRLMAELIMPRIPSCGSVLFYAGSKEYPSYRLLEQGFNAYMQENGYENQIYREYVNQINEETYQNILRDVKRPDIAAVCGASSRTSIMLGRALRESGKAGKLVAVGSDLFDENKEALRQGVFQNLIQKNPFAQGFMATCLLVEYLLMDRTPEELFLVGSQVVFSSNLSQVENASVHFLV